MVRSTQVSSSSLTRVSRPISVMPAMASVKFGGGHVGADLAAGRGPFQQFGEPTADDAGEPLQQRRMQRRVRRHLADQPGKRRPGGRCRQENHCAADHFAQVFG